MTTVSGAFLVLAIVMAGLDWFAVARSNAVLEYVSKPAATAAFLAVAATLDVAHDARRAWLLVAFVLCTAGDVFLMLPRDAFVPGLASFAVAQILFAVSFASGDTSGGRLVVGLVLVVPVAAALARRFIAAIGRAGHRELVAPVVVYLVVISAMAVSAIAGGSPVAIAGAVVFMLSDSLIAETRFVSAREWHGVGIMVTYHLALAGLALGLL